MIKAFFIHGHDETTDVYKEFEDTKLVPNIRNQQIWKYFPIIDFCMFASCFIFYCNHVIGIVAFTLGSNPQLVFFKLDELATNGGFFIDERPTMSLLWTPAPVLLQIRALSMRLTSQIDFTLTGTGRFVNSNLCKNFMVIKYCQYAQLHNSLWIQQFMWFQNMDDPILFAQFIFCEKILDSVPDPDLNQKFVNRRFANIIQFLKNEVNPNPTIHTPLRILMACWTCDFETKLFTYNQTHFIQDFTNIDWRWRHVDVVSMLNQDSEFKIKCVQKPIGPNNTIAWWQANNGKRFYILFKG